MADRVNIAITFLAAHRLEQYIQNHKLKPKRIHVVEAALDEYYENHPVEKGDTDGQEQEVIQSQL